VSPVNPAIPANPAIVERNRKAVYHALANTFVAPELIAGALSVWETQFAQQAGFRISLYATAVASELGLGDLEIRDLASNLYASMTMTEDRLPRLPTPFNGKGSNGAAVTGTQPKLEEPANPGIHDPRTAVFAKLVDSMIDGASREKKLDELMEALMLRDVEFSADVARQRMVWINRRLADSQALAARVAESEWRALVNDLYVALCEACGPVSADRHLAHSVQLAEQISEARFFSPRSLL
jgi:murein L,D-transpeptidase YcbB/YkuD